MSDLHYCEKCKKMYKPSSFYSSNNVAKYPSGKLNQCKKCITLHVDNWNPETFLWILEEIDIPYVQKEWFSLLMRFGRDPSSNSMSIIGRYCSKMKLTQYKRYRWKDTEFLQEVQKKETEETMRHQGYSEQEIATALSGINLMTLPTVEQMEPIKDIEGSFADESSDNDFHAPKPPQELSPTSVAQDEEEDEHRQAPGEDYFDRDQDSSIADSLTEEDRVYLRLKWGKTYTPEEWVRLEQLYNDMMASYEIEAAGDINNLKIMCKCSLKANQLLDLGDIESAQKATKMYNDMMKSSRWTAEQLKKDNTNVIDSIGELVAICETQGFIPRYYTDGPQDHIDRVLEDLKKYTFDLISAETSIDTMIDSALRQIEEERNRTENTREETEEEELARLFDYDAPILDNDEFREFEEFENSLLEVDQERLQLFLGSEEDIL